MALEFIIFKACLVAGLAIAVGTLARMLEVAALQPAEPLFAEPKCATALFVRFGLAGGGKIDCLARNAHRSGCDIDQCLGDTARQGQHAQRR